MNWRRRYASDSMWEHFRNHVMTPAINCLKKVKQGLDPEEATLEDIPHEEIGSCTSCCHPEYMAWEHGQIFGNRSGLLVNPDERDMMGHYHIDNQIQAGRSCPECLRGNFGFSI